MLSRGLSLFLLALLQAVGPAAAGNKYYNQYYNKNDDGNNGGGNADDDLVDLSSEDFDAVSLMPVSCVN